MKATRAALSIYQQLSLDLDAEVLCTIKEVIKEYKNILNPINSILLTKI